MPTSLVWNMEKLTERDVPELINAFQQEPEIPQALELSRKDLRNLAAYFEGVLNSIAVGERISFVLRARNGGHLLGGVTFIRTARRGNVWELSFWLRATARGQGVGLAATQAATAWMFTNGLAERIETATRPSNAPSLRLQHKQGFVLQAVKSTGHGELCYGVLHRQVFMAANAA